MDQCILCSSPIGKIVYATIFYVILFWTETRLPSILHSRHWLVQMATTSQPALVPLFGVIQTVLTQTGYYMNQIKRKTNHSNVSYIFAERTIYLGVYYAVCIQAIQTLGHPKTAWTMALYSSVCLESQSRLFLKLYPSTWAVHTQMLASHFFHICVVCLLSFYTYSNFYENSRTWLQNIQYSEFMRQQMESFILSDIIFYLHLKGWKDIYPFDKNQ